MSPLFYILASTFFISLISFIGVLTLFLKAKNLERFLLVLVAFSAGTLMGGAFLHLLPEAIERTNGQKEVFLYLLLGFCLFFILEQFIDWHHHEGEYHSIKPFSYLVLISDGVHNFIDGLVIAAAFMVDVSLGWLTVLAVALHEIPQEFGDFGILVYGGFKKTQALLINFLSGITAILGGLIGFVLAGKIGSSIVFLLSLAAGNFIYIAASDLIPAIKHHQNFKKSLVHFIVFVSGIVLMLLLK